MIRFMIGQMTFEKLKVLVNFFEQADIPCKKMDQPNSTIANALMSAIKFIMNVEGFEHGMRLLGPVPFFSFLLIFLLRFASFLSKLSKVFPILCFWLNHYTLYWQVFRPFFADSFYLNHAFWGLTDGRMFASGIGIPENPVTGNENGPFGAYLIHNKFEFKGLQDEAISRHSIVEVNVEIKKKEPVKVQVGGYATVTFKTKIII